MLARPQRLLAATIVVLVAATTAVPALATAPAHAASDYSMSVATYNIRHALSDAVATEDTERLVNAGIDVIALQEMGSRMRRDAVASRVVDCSSCPMDAYMPNGLGPGEVPILFRSAMFELRDSGMQQTSERTYVGPEGAGPSWLAAKYLTYVLLRHRASGQDVYVINGHGIASVQGPDGGPNYDYPERLRLYRQFMDGLRDMVTRFKASGAAVIVAGDFNVNYRRDSVLRPELFPYYNMSQVGVSASYKSLGMPALGTHGQIRLIDYVAQLDNGKVVPESQAILTDYQSDHRPVVVRYGVGAASKPVGTRPGSPSGVRAEAAERAARVSWTEAPANGSEITDYRVTALKVTSSQQRQRASSVTTETTSVLVGGLERGAQYVFTVQAINGVGTGPESTESNPVTPFAVAPRTTITRGPADASVVPRRAVDFGYASDVAGSSFVCSLDGVARPCGDRMTWLTSLTAGTHTFGVAARDAAGDVDTSPATRTWTVPRDSAAMRHGSAWTRKQAAGYYMNTYSRSARRGSVLSTPVSNARTVALLAARGPGHGTVRVFLDGRPLKRVSLGARTLKKQRVIPIARFERPQTGRIRVVVVSRGRTVRVDGIGASTR